VDRREHLRWRSVIHAFTDVASRHPDRTAVLDAGGELTYAELDHRTNQLAGILSAAGCGPEQAVGVFLPRTVDLVVAIIGILKAGGVYVPFDPEQPAQRLTRLTRAANLTASITDSTLADSLAGEHPVEAIHIDRITWNQHRPVAPVYIHPDALAYMIFTSGSTGSPKGVEVSHRALSSFLNGMDEGGFYSPPGTRVAWNASVAFDASVQEWGRLFRGDTVGILTDDMRRDCDEFAEFVTKHRLTEIDMTPSHAQVLIDALEEVARRGQRLRLLIAGEAVPQPLWKRLQDLTTEGVLEAVNMYGPTETAVNVLGTKIRPGDAPSIGRPMAAVAARVIDDRFQLVPDGTAGELCIAGPYLARGYSARPGLTASRFVPDPLSRHGERMYRTGDKVVRRPDGAITYLGRTDDQIKIRGHRVELGEIEYVLADHPGVTRAVALYREDSGELRAVLGLAPGAELAQVEAHAAQQLPAWMRPTHYTVVDSIPLTVGGKADRQELLKRLSPAATREHHSTKELVEP
jgi:amino acid adenylation domain-containing protein